MKGGDGRFTIEDENPLNSTFVNDARIDRPFSVSPGDAITLGRLTPIGVLSRAGPDACGLRRRGGVFEPR
jgi:hypothetical protein